MFYSFLKKLKDNSSKKSFKDPVCGMLATDDIVLVYQDQTHAFCSDYCRQQFEKDPEAYIAKQS